MLLRRPYALLFRRVASVQLDASATDVDLAECGKLWHLQKLQIAKGAKVSDAGLAHLKGLSQLRHLSLVGQPVTDAGLVHLKGLSQLQYLNLWATQVTDAGLVHLKGLSQLQDLFLPKTQVTRAGIDELKEALPDVQFTRDHRDDPWGPFATKPRTRSRLRPGPRVVERPKRPTSDPAAPPPAPPAQLPPKHGDVMTNSIGMKLVYIEPGEFVMGSPVNEQNRMRNEAQHRVRLTKGFHIGVYEVTQRQWTQVMGTSTGRQRHKVPRSWSLEGDAVYDVSWDEAAEFCQKLSRKEGREYALPTEAQWEYACRAGTTGAYAGTERLDDMGWYKSNSGGKKHGVGQKRPNAWGLYDMHGNVSEWCDDWYGNYPSGTVTDPLGAPWGPEFVHRGGGWDSTPGRCRSANRDGTWSGYGRGFRVVLRSRGTGTPPPKPPTSVPTAQPTGAATAPPPALPAQLPPKHGDVITNSIGMKLVYLAPGEFTMGSPAGEKDRQADEGQHLVKLTNGFYMGVYEVTQSQWKRVTGSNPSHFKGDDLPVERVFWSEAVKFCRKLSEQEGREYRLPTEAQWEYACRAGTRGAYAGTGSLDDMGWYSSNSGGKTHAVGQKRPNAWGFFDMHGNVSELCSDRYGKYPSESITDPVGATSGSFGVRRGGGFARPPGGCRSASRSRYTPGDRHGFLGLRVALRPRGTGR